LPVSQSPAYKYNLRFVLIAVPAQIERKCLMNQMPEKGSIVTLINIFTVEPVNQQRLIDLLTRATDGSVNRAPGFISSTLHRGIDGTKVIMYAQWRSAEDYQAMRQDPGPLRSCGRRSPSRSSNRACTRSCRLSGLRARSPRVCPHGRQRLDRVISAISPWSCRSRKLNCRP
jgi:hypothetical protein